MNQKKKDVIHQIEINNEQDKINWTDSNDKVIEKAVFAALDYENVQCSCEVSISIVDNENIREINNQFRKIDKETDVLSFPSGEYEPDSYEPCFLGDIAISVEKAEEQRLSYGHSFEREIAFLTAHSVLHLLGYDHMTDEDEKEMFSKQEEILQKIGLIRE